MTPKPETTEEGIGSMHTHLKCLYYKRQLRKKTDQDKQIIAYDQTMWIF